MAYIHPIDKLPSGIKGLGIYTYEIGKLFVHFDNQNYYEGHNGSFTKEDVVFIRDILNKALANWDKGSGFCEHCVHLIDKSDLTENWNLRRNDKYCGDFHSGNVRNCKNMKWK